MVIKPMNSFIFYKLTKQKGNVGDITLDEIDDESIVIIIWNKI